MALVQYTHQDYMRPMLEFLADGQERRITELAEVLAKEFHLTPEQLADTIPSGRKTRHYDRVGWAATYLKQAGALISPRRAFYQITERGRKLLNDHAQINTDVLQQFSEFVGFQMRQRPSEQNRTAPAAPDEISLIAIQTPDEIIENSYDQISIALETELIERVKEVPPAFFEQLVVDLLVAMGYGGSYREAAERVGQSGDGGIDGIINQDRLGLEVVYIQAKRWQGSVGARELRDFVGSLDEKKALKGVFITTSTFTREALNYAEKTSKRIILIDGQKLAQLMIEFNIGVTVRKTYVVKRVDDTYFDQELV
jgi:restriction system protein